MTSIPITAKDQAKYLGGEALAEFKRRMAVERANIERESARLASVAALRDARSQQEQKLAEEDAKLWQESEKYLAEQEGGEGEPESITQNLPRPQVNTRAPAESIQAPDTASIAQTHPGGGVGPYATGPQDLEALYPQVGAAPDFLVNQQQITDVAPEQVTTVRRAPVRRTRNITTIEQNAMTAAQRQQALLNRARAMQEQRQWEAEQARGASEFDIQEARRERTARAGIAASEAATASSRSAIARRALQNRLDLQKAAQTNYDTFADRLAKIGADELYEDDKQLFEEGIKLLTPNERQDVLRRRAVFRAEFDLKAAGTGTVKIFDPTSTSGIREMSARDAMRLHPEGWEGVPGKSMRMTVGPDGTVTVDTGAADALNPTKSIQTKLQEAILTSTNNLARIQGIEASYDPYFLSYWAQGRAFWNRLQRKSFPNRPLSPGEREFQDRYRTFAGSVMENLNRYIKEITGAQMSEAEAKRLMAASANLKLDDISFEADLRRITKELRLQIARSHMLAAGGFGDANIENVLKTSKSWEKAGGVLDRVPMGETLRIMQKIEYDEKARLKREQPDLTDEQINKMARRFTERQFGLGE